MKTALMLQRNVYYNHYAIGATNEKHNNYP